MAPLYSLEVFGPFHTIMKMVDVPCHNQLQYNTGVIFFKRTKEVEAVMLKWLELASSLGPRVGYDNDQPFFTLAMEILGFNPYTLSPAYNYRDVGELASGIVRVWHSRRPVPTNVNRFSEFCPVRRYKEGKLVEIYPIEDSAHVA